jgi:hypothetical protein
MEEKRKYKRVSAHLELTISNLFKQDNLKVEHIDSPITVTDVSKGGIGFTSKAIFPVGYYFNASLQLGENESSNLFFVAKIVRCIKSKDEGIYNYGCELVGMPHIFDYIFDEYEKQHESI